VDRRDERSNRRTRDAPIAHPSADVLAFMVTGLRRAWSKQEIAPRTRGTRSVQFIVDDFRKRLQTSRSTPNYGPGQCRPLIPSLMMKTSFRGSLPSTGDTTVSSTSLSCPLPSIVAGDGPSWSTMGRKGDHEKMDLALSDSYKATRL